MKIITKTIRIIDSDSLYDDVVKYHIKQVALARYLYVAPSLVSQWVNGHVPVPEKYTDRIEEFVEEWKKKYESKLR